MSNISYKDARSPLNFVFAIAAFGLGVDCINVHQIIYLGVTDIQLFGAWYFVLLIDGRKCFID